MPGGPAGGGPQQVEIIRPDSLGITPDVGQRTVFVLGSGFSRPLGGLLLDKLLVYRDGEVLKEQWDGMGYQQTPKALHTAMYDARVWCAGGIEQGLWTDAEDFLDKVETAEAAELAPRPQQTPAEAGMNPKGPPVHEARSLLAPSIKTGMRCTPPGQKDPMPARRFTDVSALALAARQTIAADCCVFLRAADPETERWQPYRMWASKLNQSHTVITFNYDLVPDLLASAGGRSGLGKLRIIMPHKSGQIVADRIKEAEAEECAPVLKLHGSTDWAASGDDVVRADHPDYAARAGLGSPAAVMGIPGPRKRGMTNAVLPHLWGAARAALSNANRIVFVGYRFPESDSDARTQLLGAIRRSSILAGIQTVLGSEINSREAMRLRSLLNIAVGKRKVLVESLPLFAQDYLSLVWSMGTEP